MTVCLETVGLPHAALLAGMHRICFAEPWDEHAMVDILGMPGTFGYLACGPAEGGRQGVGPQGFILCRVAADEAEVLSLMVLPPFRRRSLAAALLGRAKETARQAGAATLFLEVAADNVAGRALYSAQGFAQVGRRPEYYGPQIDALVMKCNL